MEAVLYAPAEYVRALPNVRRLISNGCGVSGWKGKLVPDTIWGLKITEACNIHDWEYAAGATIADKDAADRAFHNNMLRLIDADTSRLGRMLKPLRRRRAWVYYEAVQHLGGPAFWAEKNPPETRLKVNKGVAE